MAGVALGRSPATDLDLDLNLDLVSFAPARFASRVERFVAGSRRADSPRQCTTRRYAEAQSSSHARIARFGVDDDGYYSHERDMTERRTCMISRGPCKWYSGGALRTMWAPSGSVGAENWVWS